MTVQNSGNRKSYTGDGQSTVFSFPYKFLAAADLKVYVDGVLKALTTDYTVGTPTDNGANVTFTTAPASGAAIVILRDLAILQQNKLPSTGPFPAKTVEGMVDKLTLIAQRLADLVGRSITLNDSDTITGSTALPTYKASNLLGWGTDPAAGLQNIDPVTLATIVAFGTARADLFTGDGTTTAFTLTANPGAQANLDVAIGGVTQYPVADYIWTGGTTLTFLTPPPAGVKILARYFLGLPQGTTDSAASTFLPFGTGAVSRNVQAKAREMRKSVEDFGGIADGVTNNDSAIALAAAASGGRFHFPGPGTYVCSSGVWAYAFTAGDNVVLRVGGTNYDVSNAVAGPWRMTVDSPVLMSLRHAVTGNIVQQWQDGTGGTATYFYRGLAFKCDSHFIQAKPATNGGACDILFQRSDVNADPNGNRFNFTFNESVDRLDFSFATSASGAPVFDSFMQVVAGPTPTMAFPAIRPQFNLGVSVKQRAAGGFEMTLEPTSSTVTRLRQVGGSGTEFMRFGDNSMGFFGAAGGARPTITGSRGGNVALTNLLANLAALGLITDSTTA